MRSAAIAFAIFTLPMSSAVFADDVNRTGQPQSPHDSRSGAGSTGGDANTMGGATTERTEPSQSTQGAPQSGTHPEKEPKTNAQPDSANPQRN